jgi:uncharacterized protein YbaR (Trm112 family)
MVEPKLVALLRCPIDGSPLEVIDAITLERINKSIKEGGMRDQRDQKIQTPMQSGLINRSGNWVYPVRDGIPSLIADEAIRLEGPEQRPENNASG